MRRAHCLGVPAPRGRRRGVVRHSRLHQRFSFKRSGGGGGSRHALPQGLTRPRPESAQEPAADCNHAAFGAEVPSHAPPRSPGTKQLAQKYNQLQNRDKYVRDIGAGRLMWSNPLCSSGSLV